MQDCSGDLPGAKDASQLADGWVVVGRSGWHGICSPGKHRLCLYGVSTQQWSCRCLAYSDSASGPTRTVWPWGLDRHSWCSVVPRECATPLSHHRPGDSNLSLRFLPAWSLGWAAGHLVPCHPAWPSHPGDIADHRRDWPGYPVCLVPEGDDAAHTTVNVDIAISFCSSSLFSGLQASVWQDQMAQSHLLR